MFVAAALAMISASAVAQEAPRVSYANAKSCLTEKGTSLSKVSKESAETLARVVLYDCANSDDAANRDLEIWHPLQRELWTVSMIVHARSGTPQP